MGNLGTVLRAVSVLFFLSTFCNFGVLSENAPVQPDLEIIGNPEVLKLVKDEVQLLSKEFTGAFIRKTFRAKRSYSKYTYDVKLDQSSNYLEVKINSDNAYSFVCNGKAFILQSDGIYRLDGFSSASYLITENITTPTLTKVSSWSLNSGDRVIHAHEWKEKCFVLISNKNGTFSSIYTFHDEQMTPVFRQQIRNYGIAMSGKFFTFQWNLYLIIVNDNVVHSLTICPLFRWAGTYMDEIHSIQTRGAVAVETFTINSKEYIAIAQSQDAAGNYEVGTQILRMDAKEELEKVQLLWSYSPVTLKYIQILQFHFLVIGLAKESSICYLFAGIDFIYWQTLEGYKGQSLFIDALTLPDLEPVLLAAESNSIQFYTRSSSSTNMTLRSNSSVLAIRPPAKIAHARFLRPSVSQVYLTLVQNYSGFLTLKIYPVLLIKIEIAESQIKESESKLSQCLVELRARLNDEGDKVDRLDYEKNNILTLDGDFKVYGRITTYSNLTLQQEQTSILTADVKPDEYSELGNELSPANLQSRIYEVADTLNNNVFNKLPNVLMKSKSGEISGDYSFDKLEVKKIVGYQTNFKFETLNDVPWNLLDEYALRKESSTPQIVTGNWTGDSLMTKSIQLPSRLSDIEINDFLLKQCLPYQEVQEVYGHFIFKKDVEFYEGLIISPDGMVNDVLFSDIVLKNGPLKEIRGYKHALNLKGEGLKIEYINTINFDNWFESVMHTDGPIQYSQGVKTLISSTDSTFENFRPIYINNESWEDFYSSALVNGANQTIAGYLKVESLTVDSLVADAIGGVRFADLMTITGDQVINSYLNISSLTAQKNLDTKLINGVPLSALVVTKNEDAIIDGPVELENFKINGSITVPEYVTIAGKDVSELAKQRQKHIYYTENKNPINFRAPVVADNLLAEYINKLYWDDLKNKYWSKSSNNVPGPLDLRGRKINVEYQFNTGTLNSLNLESDVVRTDQSNSIQTKLNFKGNVVAYGEVYQADEKTLSGTDISEIAKGIVNVNEEKLINGRKHFKANIVASGGLVSTNVNGVDPTSDVVFLNSPDEQYVTGLKTFKNNVIMKSLQTASEIIVTGNVNGYDLKMVETTTAYRDEPITIYGNVHFNNSLYAPELYVQNEINGINFTNLVQNAVFLDLPQTFNFPLIIQNGSVKVTQPSIVDSINGIVLKDYFPRIVYLTPPEERINGTKTFVNLAIDGNVECLHFNGISLSNLSANAFSRTKSQSTTGKMYFETAAFDSNLNAEEIAGVRLNDLVYIDDPDSCVVNSNVRFTADRTIVRGPLLVQGLLNGYPIEKISGGMQDALIDRKFKAIDVKGDLSWENNRENLDGIGHVLENAVSLDKYPQIITGKVEFADGFIADEVISVPWINDVNLIEMDEDGLHLGEDDVTFSGKNVFSKPVKVNGPPLGIDTLDVYRVDGIDLHKLNRNVIRYSYDGTIYGKKTFADGIDVQDLLFKDLMGNGNFSWLVTTSDYRTVDKVEFYDVSIGDVLNISRFRDFDLQEILTTRVKIYGDQVLLGNYTIPGLDVTKNCKVFSINGIKKSDIFIDYPGKQQRIDGNKIFSNGLVVDGSMDLPNVNGYNFAALHSDVYKRTEKQNISRPVIFVQPVVVNEAVQVETHINDYRIEELETRFSNALRGIEERAYLENKPQVQNLEKLQALKYSLLIRPFWLEYLRFKQSWSMLPKTRVEHTETRNGVIIGLYDKTIDSGVVLPKGCECNNVQFLKISNSATTATFEEKFECKNAFVVQSPLGNVYSVLDHSVSFNQSCSTPESAETVISSGPIVTSPEAYANVLLTQSSKGFVSDVKAFSENGVDYLVVAHYFSSKTRSHDTGAFVYSLKPGEDLNLIQTIPTYGAKRIAINNFQNRWLLAIANTKDPQTDSCLTNSAVYRWSTSKGQFELLREVRTNGATDVTFITAQDKSGNYKGASLSFVAFAQNGNSGDGEVVIMLFDKTKQNYYMLESLRTKWSVTGVEFVCVQDNCFLLVVVPQEGIHFYEYRYVEGFQRKLTVPVVGAHDVGTYSWNNQLFFAIASSKRSLLAQGVVAGDPSILDEIM